MYAAATESLIKQAREIKEEELQRFRGRIFKLLHTKDISGDTVDSLQRLSLIVSATKYARELPSDLVMKLQTVLRSSSCPEQLQVLSSSIIQWGPNVRNQVNLVIRKLVDWLRYASMQQGASMSSGGFFSGPRTRQPAPLTEVDGVVMGNFFTVLCVGQSYTEDQWMNMYTFSMIKSWLLTYDTDRTTNTESDDRSEVDSSVMSMVSATSSSSRLLPPKERLREKAFEYCQRLIEQSDRMSIMDIICGEDPSYVYRAFPCIKALYGRLNAYQALLPIAQFYLNHTETAAVDSEAVFCQLFSHCPAEQFNEPMLAFEFVQFCLLNASVLQDRVANYRQSFPNLLKFLAWNSSGLIAEFVELLPSLIAPDTAIELLHTILDLPCLAAALDLQQRSACYHASDCTTWDQQGEKMAACLDAFRQPFYRGLFLYILRPEAGTGDTIDSMKKKAYPHFCLQYHFVPAICGGLSSDEKMMNQRLLVLVFSAHLQALCRLHPPLIVDQSREILEFASSPANMYSKEDFYTHVVWVIGEHLSVSYDPRCRVELITSFFESLEAVLFEITQVPQSASPPSFSPRLITVLMTTLAKLATRSQDLIPRVSLCLSKMRTFEIITRAHELINLLKLPNVAQFVLASSARGDGPRWHRDTNASLPQGMRAVSGLLHRHSSFLPT
uniref:Adaptor related protein complex 5 subunit zeta 1 n=1 Tax=Sinocyclocheilus grahami TaxID=75366 RepID=A0A672K5A7_SINGR